MFYPDILPYHAEGVTPRYALELEAAVVSLLVEGDREFIRHADLLPAMLHELRFLGLIRPQGDSAAADLLAANEAPLLRFVRERVLASEPYTHWEWLQPDWKAVRRELGSAAVEEWRGKVAEYERMGRENQRTLATPAGEAAA